MGTKDAGLRIRVDSELRAHFMAACHAQDITAAQVLRAFMRAFVTAHRQPSGAEPVGAVAPAGQVTTMPGGD
jgi:hypothetical protein